MNCVAQTPQAASEGEDALQARTRLRAVHRAVAEAKRGTPVLVTGIQPLVVLPAETAGAGAAAEFAALADGPGYLLLAPARAAAVLRRPVEQAVAAIALRMGDWMADLDRVRSLADPLAEQLVGDPWRTTQPPVLAQAALGLAKLARLLPAVLAAPAAPDAATRAESMGLLHVEAADLLAYPTRMAAELRRVSEARVPLLDARDCRVVAFRAPDMGIEHLAIVIGSPETTTSSAKAPLVRIHSECFTGDLLGSLRCDCGPQLHGAIRRMGDEGAGVLLYLAQEGRGIGLANKLRAYALQDQGLDTLDANRALGWGADERNFLIAATMLRELGIGRVRLLTNNPDKIAALAACGIEVAGRVSHIYAANGTNDRYLETKVRRFGHLPA